MNTSKLIIIIILSIIPQTIQLMTQDYYSIQSKNQCKNVNILLYEYCPLEYDEEYFDYDKNNNIINTIESKIEIKPDIMENNVCIMSASKDDDKNEESCINIKFLNGDNKCCYVQIYSQKNKEKFFVNCLYLSIEQIENIKYLESFIPKIYEPYIFRIKCDGYFLMKKYSPQISDDMKCEDLKNPSSKEQCNNIMIINSNNQCCYVETKYDSKTETECAEFDSKMVEIEKDFLNYIKLEIFLNMHKNNTENYDSKISELNSLIPKSKTIKCNTFTKIFDYSKIKFTKNDILIMEDDDNFCPFIDFNKDYKKCFDGLFFSDFISNGGKCCYLKIKFDKNQEHKECIPLSKYSRENYYFINVLIEELSPPGKYTAKVICDGFKSEYDSSSKKWKKIPNY